MQLTTDKTRCHSPHDSAAQTLHPGQKHLSHHLTAGHIPSPPPLAAPRPATWSRGRHVHCNQYACLELRFLSFHLSVMDRDCSVELAVVPASSTRFGQLSVYIYSARSSYSGRECMLLIMTTSTYRGVHLSITLFCSVPRPHACHGLCRTRSSQRQGGWTSRLDFPSSFSSPSLKRCYSITQHWPHPLLLIFLDLFMSPLIYLVTPLHLLAVGRLAFDVPRTPAPPFCHPLAQV